MRSLEHQLELLKLVRDGLPPGSWLWKKHNEKVKNFIEQHQLENQDD
jgi:hypothetical protein